MRSRSGLCSGSAGRPARRRLGARGRGARRAPHDRPGDLDVAGPGARGGALRASSTQWGYDARERVAHARARLPAVVAVGSRSGLERRAVHDTGGSVTQDALSSRVVSSLETHPVRVLARVGRPRSSSCSVSASAPGHDPRRELDSTSSGPPVARLREDGDVACLGAGVAATFTSGRRRRPPSSSGTSTRTPSETRGRGARWSRREERSAATRPAWGRRSGRTR